MTDDLQQPLPDTEPQPENPPIAKEIISPRPKKSNKYLWIIGIVVAIVGFCVCSIICVAGAVLGIEKAFVEQALVESVLDYYMKCMEAKDVESAFALFSPRAQRQFPVSKLQELIEGNNYVIFEGYQKLSVQSLNISAAVNTNPDLPQGTVAKVTGIISYEDNFQGTFNGTLENVDGNWRIDGMSVIVPPNKIGHNQDTNHYKITPDMQQAVVIP